LNAGCLPVGSLPLVDGHRARRQDRAGTQAENSAKRLTGASRGLPPVTRPVAQTLQYGTLPPTSQIHTERLDSPTASPDPSQLACSALRGQLLPHLSHRRCVTCAGQRSHTGTVTHWHADCYKTETCSSKVEREKLKAILLRHAKRTTFSRDERHGTVASDSDHNLSHILSRFRDTHTSCMWRLVSPVTAFRCGREV
jgi:hypothetical protein